MEYFAAYRADGSGWVGSGSPGTIAAMVPPEGIRVFACSPESFADGSATLVEIHAQLRETVKALRDAAIDAGAPTPFGAVDCDEQARSNVSGAALGALIAKSVGAPYSVTWTMLDNRTVTLDADGMIAMALAVLTHVNACHDRARALRADIEAAADMSKLLAIDVAAGWPKNGKED